MAAVACVALGATWLARQGVPRLGLTGRADAEAPRAALLVGRPHQVTSTPEAEREPAISPDGSLVAFVSSASGDSDISIAGVGGANLLRLTDDPAADRDPCWFPDGGALAFASERNGTWAIWKVPVLGGAATLLVPDGREPAIDPTGTWVAFVRSGANGSGRVAVAPLREKSHLEKPEKICDLLSLFVYGVNLKAWLRKE